MPVITNDSRFKQPRNIKSKLWRYMDFTKFISLITDSKLYFSRSDKFTDPYEGHASEVLMKELIIDDEDPKDIEELYLKRRATALRNYSEKNKMFTFINCWHKNEHESEAMWKLYSSNKESIAIETTYENLIKSIITKPHIDIYIGKVRYLNYKKHKNTWGDIESFMFKRISYKHENEVRLILESDLKDRNENMKSHPRNGKYIKVDLNTLITKIHISPNSPVWFEKLVKDILNRYSIKIPIYKSTLNDVSLY